MARDSLAPPPPGMPEKRKRLFSRTPTQVADFAMIQPQRSATVTSAALRQISDETRDVRRRRRNIAQSDRTWQQEAYDFAKKIGELGYLLNLQANVVALCLFPLRRWDEENNTWAPNDPTEEGFDDKPENVMDAFVGPTGGAAELYRRCAINLFTAGETHLLGSSQETGNGLLWEFLSVLEVYPDAEGNMVRKRAGINAGEGVQHLPDDSYTARCWRSSAAYTDLAESEVQRVLPICQEIINLTQMVDATVKSRIPANMIFIPDELSFAGQGKADEDAVSTVGDNEDDDADPFISELFDHMTAPVEDPKSAARLVPIVIRGKGEHGEQIQVIELSRALDFSAQDLRQEALGRLAAGLDAPPEIMQGRASVNHWTSAIIDQDFIIKHIVPVGQLMADFLTVAYLRPMLEAFEDFSEDEAMAWRLDFDPSPVIARADESKSARDLADLLSDEAVVVANGFEKGDMVQEEERFQRRLWQLVSGAPTVFSRLLPLVEGFEKIPIDDIVGAAPEPPPPAGADPRVPDTKDLVDATTGQETPDKPEGLSLLVDRLSLAADFALKRAVQRAGSRILSAAQGEQFAMVRERVQSTSKERIASLVSPVELTTLRLNETKLLDKAWDELGVTARTWIGGFLEGQGVDRYDADDRATLAAHQLCEAMQEFTASRILNDFKTQPNGLKVPADLVVGVLDQTLAIPV